MFSNLPPVTKGLLIANGLVFVLQMLLGELALAPFMLWPLGAGDSPYAPTEFLPWQLLTYGFMHGDITHLLFNMLALLMFGAPSNLPQFAAAFDCKAGDAMVRGDGDRVVIW